MIKIDLPKPSKALIDALYLDLNEKLENHVYFWETEGRENPWPIGIVENIWFFDRTNPIGTNEYQHWFDEKINVCGMIFANDTRTDVSCLPAHTDAGRMFGINYLLDQGGDNVTTTTYEKIINSNVPIGDMSVDNKDLTPTLSKQLDLHTWYGINGLRYHSVENITRHRLMLSITVENTTYDQFINKYNSIITYLDNS